MKCKKFKYLGIKNCSFRVGSYINNSDALAIEIVDEDEELIAVCTVNASGYMYYPGTATIKNYSENVGMTDFLMDLDVIDMIYSRKQCNPYATKGETIDYCSIDLEQLKKYSSGFNYEYES